MPTTLDYCRDYLVDQGLVRKPRDAGIQYPMWIEPRNGAIAPGEGQNATEIDNDLVISAFRTTGIPQERHNEFKRSEHIEFWFRGRTWPLIHDFWLLLRPKFVDIVATDTRRNWDMAGLTVLESLIFVELQRIGADETGWTFQAEVSFELFQT